MEEKIEFYDQLTDEVRGKEGCVVLGDFNGHVGEEARGYEGVHGEKMYTCYCSCHICIQIDCIWVVKPIYIRGCASKSSLNFLIAVKLSSLNKLKHVRTLH